MDELSIVKTYLGHQASRKEAFEAVNAERDYQDHLPQSRSKDGTAIRPVAGYLVMIDHYLRHSQDAWTLKAGTKDVLHDMRKIAALAIRCMEEHGVYRRDETPTDKTIDKSPSF